MDREVISLLEDIKNYLASIDAKLDEIADSASNIESNTLLTDSQLNSIDTHVGRIERQMD